MPTSGQHRRDHHDADLDGVRNLQLGAQHRLELVVEQVPARVVDERAREAEEAAQRGADRQHHQRPDHHARRLVDVVLGLVVGARTRPVKTRK